MGVQHRQRHVLVVLLLPEVEHPVEFRTAVDGEPRQTCRVVVVDLVLLIQFTITFAFLGVSFLSPQSITLNIMSYVLLESGFCLFVILQALRACVKVNDADKLVRMKCIELCTLLDFEDEEEGTEKSTARAFNGIATYLDRARVVQARVFGIYLSRELVAKVMISFLAATASALLRSGIA